MVTSTFFLTKNAHSDKVIAVLTRLSKNFGQSSANEMPKSRKHFVFNTKKSLPKLTLWIARILFSQPCRKHVAQKLKTFCSNFKKTQSFSKKNVSSELIFCTRRMQFWNAAKWFEGNWAKVVGGRGWRFLCIKFDSSEPTRVEARRKISILAGSSRVFLGEQIIDSE